MDSYLYYGFIRTSQCVIPCGVALTPEEVEEACDEEERAWQGRTIRRSITRIPVRGKLLEIIKGLKNERRDKTPSE